jgi:hypothetical protein
MKKRLFNFLLQIFLFKKKGNVEGKPHYSEVFVLGGLPTHTYYFRSDLVKEIERALSRNKACVLSGPTKSGKTVLLRKFVPKGNSFWVNGGEIRTELEFWDTLAAELHVPKSNIRTNSYGYEGKVKSDIGLKNVFIDSSISSEMSTNTQQSNSSEYSHQIKVSVLQSLKRLSNPYIVVDDFHLIPQQVQNNLVKAFKSLLFDGLKLVLVTVPYRANGVPFVVQSEMNGRVTTVEVPFWKPAELIEIPKIGFLKLGVSLTPWQEQLLAQKATGSPHLMQEFCHRICQKNEDLKQEMEKWSTEKSLLEEVFFDTANDLGRRILKELACNGTEGGDLADIYILIFVTAARFTTGKPQSSFKLEDFINMLQTENPSKEISSDDVVLIFRRLSNIAATDNSSVPVLEYDDEAKEVHITDPFFSFYVNVNFPYLEADKNKREFNN